VAAKKLSRREKEKQDRLRYIYNIAEELFSRKGYFKVKMKEIAQKTEFALATLYRFFQSKESLYRKMISHRLEEMLTKIKEEMDLASSNLKKIDKFIEAKLTFLHQHREFIPIFLSQTCVGYSTEEQKSLQKQNTIQWNKLIDNLSHIVEKAIAEGKVRYIEPLKFAFIIDHMTNAVTYNWLEKEGSENLNQDIEDIKSLVSNGIDKTFRK
jgi:TetR/AcrR family transcriptional regulator